MSEHHSYAFLPYATNRLDWTSNALSTLSGLSSGSTSSTCLAIEAYSSLGNVIVISLDYRINMNQYHVDGNDMNLNQIENKQLK